MLFIQLEIIFNHVQISNQSGCQVLRSTGFSDISVRPSKLNNVAFRDLEECVDAVTVRGGRSFWPKKQVGRLQRLALLRGGNFPPTFELFENATLDDVDAFLQSKTRVKKLLDLLGGGGGEEFDC